MKFEKKLLVFVTYLRLRCGRIPTISVQLSLDERMQRKLVEYKFLPPKINIFAPNFSNTLSFYLWSVDEALS